MRIGYLGRGRNARSSGVGAAVRRLDHRHQGQRPEVILLMGLDGSVADSSLESLGAFALLAKPARPSVLFDCLASIASGSRENGIASFYVRKNAGGSALSFDARVLVVEDNAVNQDVASGILKQMGCSVVTAANGRSAVQLFAQENFDRIRRIAGDDGSSLLGQIVSQFAATSAPLLETMRAKSRDSDPQAVWRTAHSLKSSASAIGACRVSQ